MSGSSKNLVQTTALLTALSNRGLSPARRGAGVVASVLLRGRREQDLNQFRFAPSHPRADRWLQTVRCHAAWTVPMLLGPPIPSKAVDAEQRAWISWCSSSLGKSPRKPSGRTRTRRRPSRPCQQPWPDTATSASAPWRRTTNRPSRASRQRTGPSASCQ